MLQTLDPKRHTGSPPLMRKPNEPYAHDHICTRHHFHHTTKQEIIEENKKVILALNKEIKDLKKAAADRMKTTETQTLQATQAEGKKIDHELLKSVSMREYYRMQALNLNKVFREAEKEGKVDMVYKIYWDPKKLVKPIDGASQSGKGSRPQSRHRRV